MSCFGDSTGLGERRRAGIAFQPVFDRQALHVVDFTRVHITLVRPGTTPPEVALDTTVDFPSDQDSLRLPLTVPLSAGATSESFDLTLAMLNAAGAVVFRGGPTRVTATAGLLGGQAPDVPLRYVGTGSNAAGVRFRAPAPTTAFFGDTVEFAAEAYDSAGAALAGTPVLYLVDPADTAKARVSDPAAGRVVAKTVRGPAAVVARLLTGQTARTSLLVQPRPSAIAATGGGGQTGPVGAALPQPLTVRVTAADGLGVQGVVVAFAVTSGGGSLSAASGTTDASGNASTAWTLGNTIGAQSVTATSGSLAGSPVTITATATVAVANVLVSPATATVTVGATQQLTATTKDAAGGTLTGRVVTWASSSAAVATVNGSGLVTGVAGGVATITATSEGVNGTATVTVSVGGVSTSQSTVSVSAGTVVSGGTVALTLQAKDASGTNLTTGGLTVVFTASGGTSTGTIGATTDSANGRYKATFTAATAGTATTVHATIGGMAVTSTMPTITVTAGSGIASTVVTPIAATLNALGQTVQLSAQSKDAVGANVTGSFTWVSRTPATATVNTAGLVTAVANGTSYVVVTEAGGTRDSALVTVTQTLASITVTPGTRSIYLTGRATFAALAVDGGGAPVPTQPTFVWTSMAPAVASVDTAGVVIANGLGSAQIRATAGAVIGVANVSVITPITRIAVVVDTVGAATTDTFTFTSLGLTRRYRAIAHDTLDAVMTGVTFTWLSSNGSVAVMNTSTGDTASVTSAANGVTAIRVSAQGHTSAPGAAVTVAQVLAAIELTPPAATIAPTGTVGLVARGKDANGRYISSGAFIYRSASTGVATVDSLTGVVLGVSPGTAAVTATSGPIVSNTALVTVSAQGPAIISFGRDTLSVGRGSSASIPILLSRPLVGAPLIVKLTVADTFAYWSTPTVTIPAGATSINATLNGRNAGTTTVTATDSSGAGYDPASAVLAVTATMHLTTGSYAMNATDVVSTQVLLSDPSPAGGTYVTFSYGTAGIAAISPDPAFVPAGQLAADVQIRGIGAGTTTITPTAIGVSGAASSFTAYAPVLSFSASSIRLGQGQYESYYVRTPTNGHLALPVTLTSSDTTAVTVPATVTIPSGSYYVYFTINAPAIGSATITASAPGWTASNSVAVRSTTPYVGIAGGATINTTSPARSIAVYAEDSLRNSHYRISSLVVRVHSSDTTVMKVLDTVVTIGPGQQSANGSVIPGGLGGTAYIVATASGHQPDSTLFTVVGPKLSFSWTTGRLGAGQYESSVYVRTPDNVTVPLVVLVASSDSTIASAPALDTIPAGTYYRHFTVTGKAPGTATFIASAPGYQSDTAAFVVTSPGLAACCDNSALRNFGPGTSVTVYSTDSLQSSNPRTTPLAISIVSTDPAVVQVDSSSVTIAAGQYYNSQAHITPVGLGTARIIFTAAGHTSYDTLTVTVVSPKVQFSITSARVGRRQHFHPSGSGFYVRTPDYRTSPLTATIAQLHGAVDSLTATAITIDSATYYTYLDAYGLAIGTDTLIVAAPGYLPDTAFITVTTAKLTTSSFPSTTTTTNPPIGIYVYPADSVGNEHYTMDTVVVAAVSSDSTVIRPVQPFFRVLKNANSAYTTVNVVGPGTASITYSDSAGTGYLPATTNTITVTGPSLSIVNYTTVLGMRQTGGANAAYVRVPNNVTDTLVVNLLSTDPRVVTVPASVKIPTGSYYAYFPVTAQDTVGTIQIQATATGYSAASTNVQVTQPKFEISTASQRNTTSPKYNITIHATDANGTTHSTTENVTVTLLSLSPSVAIIDSTSVVIPAGASYVNTATWSPGIVGSAQIQASDQRAAQYRYATGTFDVTVVTPTLNVSWGTQTLGIGQYNDGRYVSAPDQAVAPISVALTHTGTARINTLVGGASVSTLTIPAGTNVAYFRVVGASTGTDTLVATATSPPHNPGVAYTVVGPGRVDPLGNWPTSSLKVGDSVQVTLYTRDPAGTTHYVADSVAFTLAPNANIQFVSGGANSAVITSVVVPKDQYLVQFWVKGVAQGDGSATITATDYQPYTTPTVIITP